MNATAAIEKSAESKLRFLTGSPGRCAKKYEIKVYSG